MSKQIKAVLRRNVKALMVAKWDKENISRLAREAGIEQGGAMRVLDTSSMIQLDKIEKVAAALGVQPWELLVPGFDPSNRPLLIESAQEKELIQQVRRIAKPSRPSGQH